jgi:hypothetical protein
MRLDDKPADGTLLRALVDAARAEILLYTRRNQGQWLECFDVVMIQLATLSYARRGAEGVASQKTGDIATMFDTDADRKVLKALAGYRLAGV